MALGKSGCQSHPPPKFCAGLNHTAVRTGISGGSRESWRRGICGGKTWPRPSSDPSLSPSMDLSEFTIHPALRRRWSLGRPQQRHSQTTDTCRHYQAYPSMTWRFCQLSLFCSRHNPSHEHQFKCGGAKLRESKRSPQAAVSDLRAPGVAAFLAFLL